MENSTRFRTAALGVLLATFGFMCGYLTGERPPAPPPNPYAAAAAPPPQCGFNRRAMAMDWRSNQPYTTIIVMQDGRPIQIEQRGTFAVADNNLPPQAPPPVNGGGPTQRNGLLFAIMLLALMPMVTWAALAWNRRKGQSYPYTESEPAYQEFVPRRDD